MDEDAIREGDVRGRVQLAVNRDVVGERDGGGGTDLAVDVQRPGEVNGVRRVDGFRVENSARGMYEGWLWGRGWKGGIEVRMVWCCVV